MSARFAWRAFRASMRLSFLMTLWLLSTLLKWKWRIRRV